MNCAVCMEIAYSHSDVTSACVSLVIALPANLQGAQYADGFVTEEKSVHAGRTPDDTGDINFSSECTVTLVKSQDAPEGVTILWLPTMR